MFKLPLLILALSLAALPSGAALFPKDSNVQQIDSKGFRKALKENVTFVTAFVAPWCGHCQKLAPELVRVADGLYPLVPVYAVDCDDNKNKPLCAEQGIKGFPTIKLYPSGKVASPLEFDGTRTANSIFYWASRAVPGSMSRSQDAKGIAEFVSKNTGKPKAVLLNKSNKTPLLWRVLSNKYAEQIAFCNCRDRKGRVSVDLGYEVDEKSKHKVLVYGRDDTAPVLYEGIMKFAALSKFFDDIIDGKIDISHANADAKQEVLDIPGSEHKNQDETRIGDAGYAGFNPHANLDMEEFLKHGINPHGAGHPGATNPDDSSSAEPSRSKASTETNDITEDLKAESQTVEGDKMFAEPVGTSGEHTKDEL